MAILAGPNGSGKSTLLKALCQLIPTNGTVRPSHLGYVPQSPEFLFVTKAVRDEIAFGGGTEVEVLLDRLQSEGGCGCPSFCRQPWAKEESRDCFDVMRWPGNHIDG